MRKYATIITTIAIFAIALNSAESGVTKEDLLETAEHYKGFITKEKDRLVDKLKERAKPIFGIGISLAVIDGNLFIAGVKENTPAKSTNLRRGDQILSINEKSISSVEELTVEMRKSVGRINLKVMRDGQELSFLITPTLLRRGREPGALVLAQKIEQEFLPIRTRVNNALDALITALNNNQVKMNQLDKDPYISEANLALYESGKWFSEKEEEVDELLNK